MSSGKSEPGAALGTYLSWPIQVRRSGKASDHRMLRESEGVVLKGEGPCRAS